MMSEPKPKGDTPEEIDENLRNAIASDTMLLMRFNSN